MLLMLAANTCMVDDSRSSEMCSNACAYVLRDVGLDEHDHGDENENEINCLNVG